MNETIAFARDAVGQPKVQALLLVLASIVVALGYLPDDVCDERVRQRMLLGDQLIEVGAVNELGY